MFVASRTYRGLATYTKDVSSSHAGDSHIGYETTARISRFHGRQHKLLVAPSFPIERRDHIQELAHPSNVSTSYFQRCIMPTAVGSKTWINAAKTRSNIFPPSQMSFVKGKTGPTFEGEGLAGPDPLTGGKSALIGDCGVAGFFTHSATRFVRVCVDTGLLSNSDKMTLGSANVF